MAFSLKGMISGETLTNYSLPVLLKKVEISLYAPVPFVRSGSVHSSLVSWDNCGQAFPDVLCWTASLIGSDTMPGQQSQPTVYVLGEIDTE